jgi:hypothetical protein
MVCKRLEDVLLALARKHGIDPEGLEEDLRLDLPGHSLFVVEFQSGSPGRVCVAHYFEENGDQVPDPELWLFRTPEGWVPCALAQPFMGQRFCAREAAGAVQVTDANVLAEFVAFAEEWAEAIEWKYLKADAARRVTAQSA